MKNDKRTRNEDQLNVVKREEFICESVNYIPLTVIHVYHFFIFIFLKKDENVVKECEYSVK